MNIAMLIADRELKVGNVKLIEAVFNPIISGAKVLNYERSKWAATHYPEPICNQRVSPIMIVEGVGALRQEFRAYLSFGIFVNTPENICLSRGLERDKDNGMMMDELMQAWLKWMKAENEYLARDEPKVYADMIINGTEKISVQIK